MNTPQKIILWLSLIGTTLLWSPSFSQNQEKIKDWTKKELVENINWGQENIAQLKFKRILQDNWEEKWLEIIQNQMLIEMNKIRENNNLIAFDLNKTLSKAAQDYAIEISQTKKLSHIGKWKSNPSTRAQKAWYQYSYVFENLGKDFFSIQDAIERWMWSPSHRQNICNQSMTNIWVWYCDGYIVVLFGH